MLHFATIVLSHDGVDRMFTYSKPPNIFSVQSYYIIFLRQNFVPNQKDARDLRSTFSSEFSMYAVHAEALAWRLSRAIWNCDSFQNGIRIICLKSNQLFNHRKHVPIQLRISKSPIFCKATLTMR